MNNGKSKFDKDLTLIARFLSGEADEEEISRLEMWRKKSDKNNKIFEDYKLLWDKSSASGLFSELNLDEEWGNFKSRIGQSDISSEKSKIPFTRIFMRIAAVLLIGIFLSVSSIFVYKSIKFEKFVATIDLREVVLPDGSEISLYPGSRIDYPRHFNSRIRSVKLQGEAFFEVSHDSLHPFQVEAGKLKVQVLGTSFLVRGEMKDENIEVIVESGRVGTYLNDKADDMKVLLPGDRVLYMQSRKELFKSKNTDLNYNAWKTGIIIFDDASLEEVADVLSKTFHIKLRAEADAGCRITVKFNDKDLNYILQTLKATLDIDILKKSDEIVLVSQDC